MAVKVSMEPACLNDGYELRDGLRKEEYDEVLAATGKDPLPVILDAIRDSSEVWTVRFDGALAFIWGVVEPIESVLSFGASGWLLSTILVEKKPILFWKICLGIVPGMVERWHLIYNAIDVRHEKAIRWAKRLGFQLQPPEPMGPYGVPFCKFTVEKEDLVCAHLL